MDNELISYQHDGTRSIRDHFGFSVTNQHSTASDQVFDIKIAPVNDAPVVINNQSLTLAPNNTGTITTNHLLTTDEEDTNPNDITYVLDKDVDYGELYLNGVALEKNDTFTQADIDNNLLTYQHTGTDTTPDSFKVLIRDSENKYIGMTYYYDVMDIITFEINLHEINTAPVINNSNFTIAENQPEIGTIQATDIDGDELTYSITAGSDHNLFQINENTGQLNFINAPDYENPQDKNQNNIYELEITANDGKEDSQPADILVTVTDVDEENSHSSFDIDGDGKYLAAVDGLLFYGYLNIRDLPPFLINNLTQQLADNLINPQSGATRTTGEAIASYLESDLEMMDIDGDGEVSAAIDGLMGYGYMNIRGLPEFLRDNLTQQLANNLIPEDSDAIRTTGNAIGSFIEGYMG